jgi:hypothetical protein
MDEMKSVLASLLASLLAALLYPLLVILAHQWRRHERDVLGAWQEYEDMASLRVETPVRCDGGIEGEPERPPLLEEVPLPDCVEAWVAEWNRKNSR